MSAKDDLRAARALIERPECWTKGAFARNANGVEVNESSDSAVRFCLMGAIKRVTGSAVRTSAARALLYETGKVRNTLTKHNDYGNHADVLALIDEALK